MFAAAGLRPDWPTLRNLGRRRVGARWSSRSSPAPPGKRVRSSCATI